jgi:hypothetical protein
LVAKPILYPISLLISFISWHLALCPFTVVDAFVPAVSVVAATACYARAFVAPTAYCDLAYF